MALLNSIYQKDINRAVNPAVSATKDDAQTRAIEIEEYVFTDEIINGLTRILNAIKNNKPYDHVGIWIDGYYGSGKSHFLKYLNYCFNKETQDKALARLLEVVRSIDPMDSEHTLEPTSEFNHLQSIAAWLKTATVDTCIFNLETSYDQSTDKKKAFLHVFWNEFNGKRGFNKFNITLAQKLEKPLETKGVFDQFKQRILEETDIDWNNASEAADLIDNELDAVLDIACELAPTLDKQSIRERIIKRDTQMSIDLFAEELKSYLQSKDDNYRLILLADEVSQFINKEKDRYLNLQEIITKLSEACDNKVWVACTAQQELSDIMDDCNIAAEKDAEGKIKGRFEVNVSLKGTHPEVITQKRILDKSDDAKLELSSLYRELKDTLPLTFKLPNGYDAYENEKSFVDYYPFVPYQFALIMRVFNSFLNLGYVAKQVKGNERSIIKVVHATAKMTAGQEVGKFVAFDELYNSMFEEGLQNKGQKAIDNAVRIAKTYTQDPVLAKRIVNILFMVCNISTNDQLIFQANVDNITSLLVTDATAPRLTLKEKVEKVLEFLCDNNVIRREPGKNGAPDYYSFYSEEEMKVAELIKSQVVDNSFQSDMLKEIITKYLKSIRNKEQYKTRSFSMYMSIKGRSHLGTNGDISIAFELDPYEQSDTERGQADAFAVREGIPTRMVYYMGYQYKENTRLRNNFNWYCKANMYMRTPVANEENAKTREEFKKRAKQMLEESIEKGFYKILDTCPVICGQQVFDNDQIGSARGDERYKLMLDKHFSIIYNKAHLVEIPGMPRTNDGLRTSILRKVNPGDYDGLNLGLTPAEREVDIYLNSQYGDVCVSDIVDKFAKAPYGWDALCTLYEVNELVRRHKRDYSYNNDPNVETQFVANKLATETNKFTVHQSAAIDPQVINDFIAAWKAIFGVSAAQAVTTNDSSQLFRSSRENLKSYIDAYRNTSNKYSRYVFIGPIRKVEDMLQAWIDERDPLTYFRLVIDQKADAATAMDLCKQVNEFLNDQLEQYKENVAFARNNSDNFQLLPADQKDNVDKLNSLENAEWPIAIREYIKARNAISGALDAMRTDLRAKIREAYNNTFRQLEEACEAQGVDKSILSDKDATIITATSSDSIALLQTKLSTDTFFSEQSAKILAEYNRLHPTPTPQPKTGDDGGNTPPTVPATPANINVALSTRTVAPLRSAQDVDAYLEKLRTQLMKHINDGKTVTVIR